MTVELQSVTIQARPYTDPDLSHLGEYQDEPGPEPRTVDRKERGDMGRGELRYFVAAPWHAEEGDKAVQEVYKRAEAFNRGVWTMLAVKAEATITVNGVRQTVDSGDLYGVASDGSAEHLENVAREQLAELRDTLAELGVELPDRLKATWADDAPLTGTVAEEGPA